MYADNIIYYLGSHALGDEIHMHRNVLLSLLAENIITDDIVVYCLADRAFLYSCIFKNIFCYDSVGDLEGIKIFCDVKFEKNFVVVRYSDICLPIWQIWRENGGLEGILTKEISITRPNVLNYQKKNYYNSQSLPKNFLKLVTNFSYLPGIPKFEKEGFIVYHHRVKNDNLWDGDEKILKAMLGYVGRFNLVIFSQKSLNLFGDRIYSTSDLREYATFINSANCLAIVSVWSGGGQLASYCSNGKLFMYFHPMQVQYGLNADRLGDYIYSENAFDFAQFTNVDRRFVTIQDVEYNLPKLIV